MPVQMTCYAPLAPFDSNSVHTLLRLTEAILKVTQALTGKSFGGIAITRSFVKGARCIERSL